MKLQDDENKRLIRELAQRIDNPHASEKFKLNRDQDQTNQFGLKKKSGALTERYQSSTRVLNHMNSFTSNKKASGMTVISF